MGTKELDTDCRLIQYCRITGSPNFFYGLYTTLSFVLVCTLNDTCSTTFSTRKRTHYDFSRKTIPSLFRFGTRI